MKRAAPLLLFAAVTVGIFWRFLLFGQTLYAMAALESQLGRPPQAPRDAFGSPSVHTRISDNLVVLAGQLRLYNEGLKANELRLWNPRLVCGMPAYADPMLHPFYPPNLLLHRLLPPDAALEISLMLHLWGAGGAMYALLRTAGRGRLASTAGGLIWMLSGYSAMWFSTSILAGVMVFGPLAMAGLLRGLETHRRWASAGAATAFGLAILGSHPQHAVLFFLFVVGYLAARALRDPRDRRFIFETGGLFAVLSLGIGLADLLTRLDTIEHGYRSPEFDQGSLYVEPWRLATYVAGLVFGKVYFPGPGWESEFPVYAGLAATGLAVVGAVRHWARPGVRYFAGVGLGSLGVAFVAPAAWMYSRIPILGLSPPSRCLFLTALSIALLAAEGLEALAEDPGRAPQGAAALTGVFFVGLAVGRGPLRLSTGAALETALGFVLVTGALVAASRWRRLAGALALAAILFELLPPFLHLNAHVDSALLARVPEPVRSMEVPGGPWRGTGLLGTRATSSRSDEWMNDLVVGNNLLALFGVENVGGFEAILPRRTVAFAAASGNRTNSAGRTLEFVHFDSPLVDFLGLRRALLPAGVRMPPRFRRIRDFPGVSLYDNPAALPRARLATRVEVVRDEGEAEQALRAPQFDPSRSTIIESPGPLATAPGGEVRWKERTSDRQILEVSSDGPGVLVVADPAYPGWEAAIDGSTAPILPANLAFRAVAIPAGRHTIVFRFRPRSVREGLLGSSLFLVLAAAGALYGRSR